MVSRSCRSETQRTPADCWADLCNLSRHCDRSETADAMETCRAIHEVRSWALAIEILRRGLINGSALSASDLISLTRSSMKSF